MSLPDWPGASAVYGKARALLEAINQRAYAAQRACYRRKSGFRFSPPEDAIELTAALNRGDEETLKWLVHHLPIVWGVK
jgi:hypothetical protein